MRFRPVIIDDSKQELTPHGTEDFPFSMDEQNMSPSATFLEHWHREIQISVVTKGEVLFRTPHGDIKLGEGEGIFINGGVLHQAISVGNGKSTYICMNFLPSIIYGQLNSVIRKQYVDPVLFCPQLQALPLKDEPWQKEICQHLLTLGEESGNPLYGFELNVKILLCKIWSLLIENNRTKLEERSSMSFSDRNRMNLIKEFIHKNYMEKIGLSEIAKSAFISRSECCRLFNRVENTTPILYLKQHRISQSIKFLTCTDLSISEIALQTGFSSSSYYAESFKNEMGITPLEYRKKFVKETSEF